jgi:hypothetical protein
MSTNTPDTRPLSERFENYYGECAALPFQRLLIELARRVEALEARRVEALEARPTTITAADMAATMERSFGPIPQDPHALALAEIADLRAQLVTARQEGAEAERKRIAEYCEECVCNWQDKQKTGDAISKSAAPLYAACWRWLANHLRNDKGGAA